MAKSTIPASGLWSAIAALLNSMFTELYDLLGLRLYGVYNYDDSVTNISIPVANTWYNLTNADGGPQSLKHPLPGIAEIYDTTTQAFDFSSLSLGDSVDIRIDLDVTSTALNQSFDVSLFLADDTGTPIPVPYIVEQSFRFAGTRKILRFSSSFIGSKLVKDNQARFKIRSSDPGSVLVRGWYVRVWPAKIGGQ